MEMVQTRREQYRELCTYLGIGMYKIDVLNLRRISKATGRYVPVYKPQEVDDRSYPQRVHLPEPTYGDQPAVWPTDGGELTAYQGRSFTAEISFEYTTGTPFVGKLLNQRGSVVRIQDFAIDVVEDPADSGMYTATLSLTADETMRLANRTYWSIQVDDQTESTTIPTEVKGGNFFTVRASEVVL
jgi:hypothetical protein